MLKALANIKLPCVFDRTRVKLWQLPIPSPLLLRIRRSALSPRHRECILTFSRPGHLSVRGDTTHTTFEALADHPHPNFVTNKSEGSLAPSWISERLAPSDVIQNLFAHDVCCPGKTRVGSRPTRQSHPGKLSRYHKVACAVINNQLVSASALIIIYLQRCP